MITGWANYYSHVVSSETFKRCDYQVWNKLWIWAKRRHPNKSTKWIKNKYFHQVGTRKWTFQAEKGETLRLHADIKIVRHVKVKGEKHIYDGDTIYWAKRGLKDPTISPRRRKLLAKQKGKCQWCHQDFESEDILEIDHIKPKNEGGRDIYANLQHLHGHCHDTKTQRDKVRQRKKLLTQSDWEFVK